MNELAETGVIHGRFQVLHNDHLKYLLAGKARCRHLVVGVTNPDPTLTRADSSDADRSSRAANPLTYYERYWLVRESLCEAGLDLEEFSVLPFPINFPELYRYYVPLTAVFYLTIYDSWGEKKREMFQEKGLKTEVMWRKPAEEKGLAASEIREMMVSGGPWQDRVPPAAVRLLRAFGVVERLRSGQT